MQLIAQIAIDLASPGITPRIHGKQDDSNSRFVAISLYNNGVAQEIPAGTQILMRYRGPSGALGVYDQLPNGGPAFIAVGNTVHCALVDQMFAAPGRVYAELQLTDSQSSVSTWEFWLDVEASKSGVSTLPMDYINAFGAVAQQVAADADRAAKAAASVDTSTFLQYADYDPTGEVKAAGGIADFVAAADKPLQSSTVSTGDNFIVNSVVYGRLAIVTVVGLWQNANYNVIIPLPAPATSRMASFAASVYGNSVLANASVSISGADRSSAQVFVKKAQAITETATVTFAYITE